MRALTRRALLTGATWTLSWNLIAAASALAGGMPAAHAAPQCTFLGQNYPVPYTCGQYQPQLPYGTHNNNPISGPELGTNCALPMNQHNQACL